MNLLKLGVFAYQHLDREEFELNSFYYVLVLQAIGIGECGLGFDLDLFVTSWS